MRSKRTSRSGVCKGQTSSAGGFSGTNCVKAKAEYQKATAGKKHEELTGDQTWKPAVLADYLPGDQVWPYCKLWYDPTGPHAGRSQMAKADGTVDARDGLNSIGRGLIQLTWRPNYRAAGTALKLEFKKNPDSAAELDNAIRVAAWYWKSRSLNNYPKENNDNNFKSVTQKINPGPAGLADCQNYSNETKSALRLGETWNGPLRLLTGENEFASVLKHW